MERIIITGSRGLIGSGFTKYLKNSGKYYIYELDIALGHDLNNESFVERWFRENDAEYLVNLFALNHHITSEDEKETLFGITLESFQKYLQTNVVSLFSVCREFAKNASARSIVNFSSTYGVVSPQPTLYRGGEKHIGYGVSKAAVIQLTKHLAVHLAPRIRVNCIIPGGVNYEQSDAFKAAYAALTPLGRMMDRHELYGILEYLCSPDSGYMTGSSLTLDGGWTAW